jgi:hypothetical protein
VPPPSPAAVAVQAHAVVQGAWRNWRRQPTQEEGLVVAAAAQYPVDRVTIEVVYPVDTAVGVLRREYEVLRWKVVKVEPQPGGELLVPVLTRSPHGKA